MGNLEHSDLLMTVQDLIDMLSDVPDKAMPVVLYTDYSYTPTYLSMHSDSGETYLDENNIEVVLDEGDDEKRFSKVFLLEGISE